MSAIEVCGIEKRLNEEAFSFFLIQSFAPGAVKWDLFIVYVTRRNNSW